ncbi:Serine/threonine-protein kinase PrkC [Aquisphaera giovannonii]|uniref:Serine/threonine-protein kinase PrkC n=1 Tax=Aquisphaera giovannonii TaxID=406548 RepID=A0A5B9VUT4_9BACT|nr:serine/threonine-protein kinase [Aquisphaera giovannonii]QEH32153.1 Serine/threonine-protein kinase PrkC [Aquisphaera giovannonii]
MPPINREVGGTALLEGSTTSLLAASDSGVAGALEEYSRLLRRGRRPGRAEFLAKYPEIAEALGECLDGLEMVQAAAFDFSPCRSAGEAVALDGPEGHGSLGEFRLIREIGRGGMGVVYEAEQVTLGRRVALKVLPGPASMDARHCRRFQMEAQAAGLLHHEHIVPVYAVGEDRGTPYFAMQLIDGPSLARVIEELAASPRPGRAGSAPDADADARPVDDRTDGRAAPSAATAATPRSVHDALARARGREAARLGLQAAEALEHAHQLGVIHRDVKPSNLLVDGRGKLWVADFGLARLPGEGRDLTQTGDLVGTLRYMSPEQARAERAGVGPATDVYSLGVTLYELATLRPAFRAPDRQELLRRILHDEPAPARSIDPSIPRDLETIILKAMEKDPAARYATAGDLAADLGRFLDDLPIRARRPGPLGRAAKWARRHRSAVLASVAGLLLGLSAVSLILWRAVKTQDQALTRQRLGIEYALGSFDQLVRPLVEGKPRPLAGDPEAARILGLAIAYDDRIPGLFTDTRAVRETIAGAARQAGYCRMALGRAKGRDDYRRSIALYEQLAAEHPDYIWLRTRLIETLREYAGLLDAPGDREESSAAIRRAVAVAGSLVGDRNAGASCYQLALAPALRGLVQDLLKAPDATPEDAGAALRLARQLAEWHPDDAEARQLVEAAVRRNVP